MMVQAYGIALYKREDNSLKLLLCKSVDSDSKYGFLKGVQIVGETQEETAIREFYEESSIRVSRKNLEEFFIQHNEEKDVGVYMVNYHNIKGIENFFDNDSLKEKFICSENSEVRFFDIASLPSIKKKQIKIVEEIKQYVNQKT